MMRGRRPSRLQRGFTLVELMLAVVIASFVLSAMWVSLGQLTTARATSRERLGGYLRVDAALNEIRRDVMSVLRSDDLYWCKLRIVDNVGSTPGGLVDRDDLLLFSSRLRLTRELYDQGEGVEYETQYRIEEDNDGTMLWQRRDAVPDEYFDGGGVVTPLVEGIIGFNVEAFDGTTWWDQWESDDLGLPKAIRLTLVAGASDDPMAKPIVLRTVVSIDRVVPPFDAEDDDDEGETTDGETDTGGAAGGTAP